MRGVLDDQPLAFRDEPGVDVVRAERAEVQAGGESQEERARAPVGGKPGKGLESLAERQDAGGHLQFVEARGELLEARFLRRILFKAALEVLKGLGAAKTLLDPLGKLVGELGGVLLGLEFLEGARLVGHPAIEELAPAV